MVFSFSLGASLERNDYMFMAPEAESTVIFQKLAASKISEPELSAWFKDNTKKSNASWQ